MVATITTVGLGIHRFALILGLSVFKGAIIITGYSMLFSGINSISNYLGGKAAKWMDKHPRFEKACSNGIYRMRRVKGRIYGVIFLGAPNPRAYFEKLERGAAQVVRPFSWMKKKLIALW